jgi:citrate synthase
MKMSSDILFEVTKDNLESGLRGVPVGYCVTSSVDPQKGLHYVGKPLTEMVDWEPTKVIDLLFHGKERSLEEVQQFEKELANRAHCSPQLIEQIRKLPREAHPMKLFSIALLLCGALEGKGDMHEDCLDLIAKIPEIACTVINHHAGWSEGAPSSNPTLGYMENFSHMLNVPDANKEELTRLFKLFNVLHYDHGGGNLSAFVGKAVASGLEDLYGSIASSMCALAGPRHGKANQNCLEFVKKVHNTVGENAKLEDIEALLRSFLANKELIYGFGHAVLRVEDPRATVFYELAEKYYSTHALCKIAALLRVAGPKVLKENPKISNPYSNIDAISGIVLTAAGFSYPEYYTVLFGTSRSVGIAIQIVYERYFARGGKGVPIVRPKYFYKER